MDVQIEGGELVVPHPSEILTVTRGDLCIRDGTIVRVASEGEVPPDFSPERVDASGCAVMPGLVNAHCHAGMSLLRGYADDLPLMRWLAEEVWPAEAHLTGEHIYWGTALAVLEMLKGGICTYADMYFHVDHIARASRELGMRAVLSLGLIGEAPGAEQDLERSAELVQRWGDDPEDMIQIQLGPHAPYTCSPQYLERVARLGEQLGCGIHIHLAETRDEVQQIEHQYGKTPVEHVCDLGITSVKPFLAAHCVHVDEEDIARLADEGVGVAHCSISNQKLGSGIAPLAEMINAGVCVGFGTDGACSTGRLDIWNEMRSGSLVQKGTRHDAEILPAAQMLHSATRGAARAVGLEDAGQLVPGYRADVTVVSLESAHLTPQHDILSLLAYAAGPGDVRDVYVQGRPVVRQGQLRTVDEGEIISRAAACTENLRQKVCENSD